MKAPERASSWFRAVGVILRGCVAIVNQVLRAIRKTCKQNREKEDNRQSLKKGHLARPALVSGGLARPSDQSDKKTFSSPPLRPAHKAT